MRDEEGNQFILCFWRAADRSYVRAADFLLLWIMHAEKGRGNDRSGERCADFKWPDKRPSEARRCTETDGKVLEFRRIFTHIRIKLILVFVSGASHKHKMILLRWGEMTCTSKWTCTWVKHFFSCILVNVSAPACVFSCSIYGGNINISA